MFKRKGEKTMLTKIKEMEKDIAKSMADLKAVDPQLHDAVCDLFAPKEEKKGAKHTWLMSFDEFDEFMKSDEPLVF
jgi:hypothetical protein